MIYSVAVTRFSNNNKMSNTRLNVTFAKQIHTVTKATQFCSATVIRVVK